MAKLITTGNVALFEYPECDEPSFDLDKDGVLFVFGYKLQFGPLNIIGSAKRFETGLKEANILWKYDEAKADPELVKIVTEQNLDKNNLVVFKTQHTINT